jgi:hypothetical protein
VAVPLRSGWELLLVMAQRSILARDLEHLQAFGIIT